MDLRISQKISWSMGIGCSVSRLKINMATCAGWGIGRGMDSLPTVDECESLFHGRLGHRCFDSLSVLLFDRTDEDWGNALATVSLE